MGCNEAVDDDCRDNEYPYHEVYLDTYFIDRAEVTQAAYGLCVDAGECKAPGCAWDPSGTPKHPVRCVDWYNAKKYCEWAGSRLPTEAEWEKAARGTDGREYPWGNVGECDLAVKAPSFDGCGPGYAMPVCSFSPAGDSPYGLCDMAGNVFEWVLDWHNAEYYSESPKQNPKGPDTGTTKIKRGGSFGSLWGNLRVSSRLTAGPSSKQESLGFRCASDE